MDKLAAMTVFAAVVEKGSFSAAARELNMAKSAVSTIVKALEADLGVALLNRTTRTLSLTEAGQRYKLRAEQILAAVEDADCEAAAETATPRGTLRVSAGVSFGAGELGPVIAAYMAAYPDMRIDLQLADRFVDLVDEGFDLAVRIGDLPDSSLIAKRIATTRRICAASPQYLESRGQPETPQDLRQHQCVLYSLLAKNGSWPFQSNGQPIDIPVSGRLSGNNGDVLRMAAINGAGIFYGPSFIIADDLRAGRLLRILKDFEPAPFGIHAVYPPSRHVSAKLRSFIDFLGQHCGNPSTWDQGLP